MLLIGELINCTRKKIAEAAQKKDAEYFKDVARKQVAAGADFLDVNGGIAGHEVECITWLVNIVKEATDAPLCLDSSDPEALRAALPLCPKQAMINSISDEADRYRAVLPLVKEFNTKVIALCMSESGPPMSADERISTACRLVDRLLGDGVPLDNIHVDPCIMPVSTGSEHGPGVLNALTEVTKRYPGIHTNAGLSNVSYGLPLRKIVNETFLVLMMSRGLDTAIVDPLDQQLMANVRAAEALLGRDAYCAEYLRAFREGKLELVKA